MLWSRTKNQRTYPPLDLHLAAACFPNYARQIVGVLSVPLWYSIQFGHERGFEFAQLFRLGSVTKAGILII